MSPASTMVAATSTIGGSFFDFLIWDSVPKPEAHKHSNLSEFFNVKIVALSSYEEREEEFKEQVANLRQMFFQSIAPGGLAADRRGILPASGFSYNAKTIWDKVKENKVLQLTGHAKMVATVLCEEIAKEKYSSFIENKDWLELEEEVKSHLVPDFGNKLSSMLDSCLCNYDKEADHYDGDVQSEKRESLNEKLVQHVRPAYKLMFEHIRSEVLHDFKTALNNTLNEGHGFAVAARDWTKKSITRFDELCEEATVKQANWDTTKIRDKFMHDLDSHITEVRAAKLYELTTLQKKKLKEALVTRVETHLKEANDNTWPSINTLFRSETKRVVEEEFSSALSDFEMDEQEKGYKILNLKDYGRGLVEEKTREVGRTLIYLVSDRFKSKFCYEDDKTPRDWTDVDLDIQAIAKDALSEALKLMSVLSTIRLDDTFGAIWASETWEEIPGDIIITPAEQHSVLAQCKSDIITLVNQASSMQIMQVRENNKWYNRLKAEVSAAFKRATTDLDRLKTDASAAFKRAVVFLVEKAINILGKAFEIWVQKMLEHFSFGTIAYGISSVS